MTSLLTLLALIFTSAALTLGVILVVVWYFMRGDK